MRHYFDHDLPFHEVPLKATFNVSGTDHIKDNSSIGRAKNGAIKSFSPNTMTTVRVFLEEPLKIPDHPPLPEPIKISQVDITKRMFAMRVALEVHKIKPTSNIIAEANDILSFINGHTNA